MPLGKQIGVLKAEKMRGQNRQNGGVGKKESSLRGEEREMHRRYYPIRIKAGALKSKVSNKKVFGRAGIFIL